MESFGVTGNGRLWAGGWRILLERPLALQQVSGEEREGPYGPAFASHPPTLCAAANVGGEEQEIK